MSVTLNQILVLVGRLDDVPGFDTPRERFRRFLNESVTDVHTVRALIEDAHRSIGEQSHRALQDAVVVLGRFLGFETTFGTYQRPHGAVQDQGQWWSRRRLHVALEILTGETERTDIDDSSRSIAGVVEPPSPDTATPRLVLSIVTPFFAARGRLEETSPAHPLSQDHRIASTRSLLWLAGNVSAGRITHDEVVKLLLSGSSLDLVADLLERFANQAEAGSPAHAESPEVESEPDFWAATTDRSAVTAFEHLIGSAVGKRHVLGVGEDKTLPAVACAGDWICFFLPGKGVVGHAQVSAPADAGTALMRDSDPSSRMYRLKNITLYDAPLVPDLESQQNLIARHQKTGVLGPLLVPLSRQKFELITARPVPPVVLERLGSESARNGPDWPEITEPMLRSRA